MSARSRRLPGRRAALATAALAVVAALVLAGGASAGGGGGGGGGGAPARLPADFPSDVPLPAGRLQGSTGSAGSWTVLLLVQGSAADVGRSTVRFYEAAGFTSAGTGVVQRGPVRITIAPSARDHSPTETNLALGVTDARRGAQPAGLVAQILLGRARVRLATVRRRGLRVRFIAPAAASAATVRAYRTIAGRRRLAASRVAAVHGGTNAVALDAADFRRRATVGSYALEVVLRGAGGEQGRPASTSVRVVR